MPTSRFRDNKRYLNELADRVLVECPHCKSKALVKAAESRFLCGSCGKSQTASSPGWVGMAKARIRRKCGWCGHQLRWSERRPGPHARKVAVHCPECSRTSYIAVLWTPDPSQAPHDPCFGYPLWLQTRCAGQVLWAYNEDHLEFLRDYVGASLRERTPNANATLASRLPTWIKMAKHRPAVLRAIKRLQEKRND